MLDRRASVAQFPCRFPVKAMGLAQPDFDTLIVEIIRRHAPPLTEGAVTLRSSSGGKYVAVTVVIDATSREQLDAIYQDLTDDDRVVWAL